MIGSANAQGSYKLSNLNQGKFQVTKILKEYDFRQSSFQIDIKVGDHVQKVLTAKRVSFRAFSLVSQINGQPMTDGRIVAKLRILIEKKKANIDQDGFFRVRRLIPNHKYSSSSLKSYAQNYSFSFNYKCQRKDLKDLRIR